MRKKIFSIIWLVSLYANSQTTVTLNMCGKGVDAYLASGQANLNWGNHPNFGGNTWTCSGPKCNARGLMRFDLFVIPTTATITAAQLYLFADLGWGPYPTWAPGNDGSILKVTAPWNENTVTWNSQPPTVTTNSIYIPASTSNAQNYTINIAPLVQDWVTNPATNYGYLLKMNDEINTYKSLIFASSDNSNPSLCPYLTVTYIMPLGVSSYENSFLNSVDVYPNPGNGDYKIKGAAGLHYSVIDNLGKLIREGIIEESNTTLSLSGFKHGIYFILFKSGNNTVTKKLVKIND